MSLAPVALFVYNRLWHTKQTVEALLQNSEAKDTELFVFSDGPRGEKDEEKVLEVREFIKNIGGFKSVEVIESRSNKGLANSIIGGLGQVLKRSEKVIVLEDDIVTSRYFLSYMNQALDMYEHDEKVISIHAYLLPVKDKLPQTFFLRGADCWGWATWRRGWEAFEPNGLKLLQELQSSNLIHDFDFQGAYSFSTMLADQIQGKNDSWAVRWHASAFLKNRFTLYPGVSLVKNIGLDNSGTHSGLSDDFAVEIAQTKLDLVRIPVEENEMAKRSIALYMKGANKSFTTRVVNKIKRLLRS